MVFIFNFILHWFQVYSLVARQSHTLHSVPLDIFSTHLAEYTAISIFLTTFPMLCFTSPGLFCNYPFELLSPFTSFTRSPTAPPLWQPPVLFVSMSRRKTYIFSISLHFYTKYSTLSIRMFHFVFHFKIGAGNYSSVQKYIKWFMFPYHIPRLEYMFQGGH